MRDIDIVAEVGRGREEGAEETRKKKKEESVVLEQTMHLRLRDVSATREFMSGASVPNSCEQNK